MSEPVSYSWGMLPRVRQAVVPLHWRDESLPSSRTTLLPWGLGRSYGDVCVNENNTVLSVRGLDRIIEFDRQAGTIHCEAGMSFREILEIIVPSGWFLPVVPGTKFVTLGGAIANDVHGKNHEQAGSFGRHVIELELVRSDRGRMICSATANSELFQATVGGMGLTGLILSAKVQLIPIESPSIEFETIRFSSIEEFARLSAESRQEFEYIAAWVDCVSGGSRLGRGFLTRGRHCKSQSGRRSKKSRIQLNVPFAFPDFVLNSKSVRVFNAIVYHKQRKAIRWGVSHYDSFLFQLDALGNWNRIYGRRGFYQYQCVLPVGAQQGIEEILGRIGKSREASFLAVLKEFGPLRSPGMMSFPREGLTLALDFPNRGSRTLRLMDELDAVVADAGGAVYPAKDARMSGEAFFRFFRRATEFSTFRDPRFSSSFWRRVTGEASIGD